jgi:sulfide:quinone oxidoreductase
VPGVPAGAGLRRVRDRLRACRGDGHQPCPEIYAVGIAAAIKSEPLSSHKEFGEMAAVCMMDAGNNGVMILADHMLPPRKAGVMSPGPQVHTMKVAFEKYFLWKSRHGYVWLP